jgi:hypothetical protein
MFFISERLRAQLLLSCCSISYMLLSEVLCAAVPGKVRPALDTATIACIMLIVASSSKAASGVLTLPSCLQQGTIYVAYAYRDLLCSAY